jgi:hypothetical protein
MIMKVEQGRIFSSYTCALAGFIKCRYCGAEVVQISAKNRGYYGCCNAKEQSCDNKLLISSKVVEAVILNDLKEKFLTPESFKHADEVPLKGLSESTSEESLLANAHPTKSCSYYVAYTSIQAIALLLDK